MKHIKGYNDYILNEATADIVFHFTGIANIINILSENEMMLSPAVGIRADQEVNKNKFYYLSMTTTGAVNTGYARSISDKGKVRIVFDGRKLKQNFKTGRVDYWQAARQPDGTKDGFDRAHRFNEMEDRIFSDKPAIENVNRYINRIDILIEDSEVSDSIRHIQYLANQKGIALNVYIKKDHINLNLTDKAVKVEPLAEIELNDRKLSFYVTRLLSLLFYKNEELTTTVLNTLTSDFGEIVEAKSIDRYRLNSIDFLHGVNADIGNVRSSGNKAERYVLDELFKDMKRNKCRNLQDYIDYKYWLGKYSPASVKQDMITVLEKTFDEVVVKYMDSFYSFYVDTDGYERKPVTQSVEVAKVIRDKKNRILQYIKGIDIENEYSFRIADGLKELLKLTEQEKKSIENVEYNEDVEDVLSDLENRLLYVKSDVYDAYYDGVNKMKEQD
jgi:hypothetical protein